MGRKDGIARRTGDVIIQKRVSDQRHDSDKTQTNQLE